MTARKPPRINPKAPPLRKMLALALLHAMGDYWIPKAKQARRIRRRELAEAIGVGPDTIGDWLRADRDIPTERITELCAVLDIPVARLLVWAAGSEPGWTNESETE